MQLSLTVGLHSHCFLSALSDFQGTFTLGEYPMKWIEWLVGQFGDWISIYMPDGILKDLIVDGIIGGVGSVLVFLPNIMILYLFISLLEDSGYMARALSLWINHASYRTTRKIVYSNDYGIRLQCPGCYGNTYH